MKIKNKGKVHPSPLHHHLQNSSSNTEDVVVSVMKLLPTTILALASILSLQDREVLAYMITRSLQTTTTTSTKTLETYRKRAAAAPSKRTSSTTASFNSFHRPLLFDCDCFGCYTSYWLRWDSSPNRELIHQVIEAFEDHLLSGEQNKKNSRAKRREKASRNPRHVQQPEDIVIPTSTEAEIVSSSLEMVEMEEEINVSSPARSQEVMEEEREEANEEEVVTVAGAAEDVEKVEDIASLVPASGGGGSGVGSPAVNNHKGLARKVLPDVLGILNSRLWNLWSPNV